jgi:hypothetical protein
MVCRIKRVFPARDNLQVGQIVDCTKWRNRALLAKLGYIEILPEPEPEIKPTVVASNAQAEIIEPNTRTEVKPKISAKSKK